MELNNQESSQDGQKPQEDHLEKTSKFINETSLDEMIEIAEIARRKKGVAELKYDSRKSRSRIIDIITDRRNGNVPKFEIVNE